MKEIPIWHEMRDGFRFLLKWLPLATLTGIVLGIVGGSFHHAIDIATELRTHNPWVIWLLPLVGALISLIYIKLGLEKDPGTNVVLRALHSGDHIPYRLAPAIFLGATLTHFAGGSSGREGAALQLGGSVASWIGHRFKLPHREMILIIMCGMSATFSALCGTPLTAALFPVEVASVGIMHPSAFLPCLLASMTGFAVANLLFHVSPTAFHVAEIPEADLLTICRTIILGILCAAVAVLFCTVIHKAVDLYKKYFPNLILRTAVGGALVLILTLLVGSQDYNGAGMHIVEAAIGGSAFGGAFLLKLLFTAVALGSGFKGGEIVPVFFVGSTFGCVVAPLLGLPASFGAAAALVAVFCGVVNCPIASFLLALELFGGQGLTLFAVIVTVTHLMAGYIGLYHDQHLPYSKYQPEFINHQIVETSVE